LCPVRLATNATLVFAKPLAARERFDNRVGKRMHFARALSR